MLPKNRRIPRKLFPLLKSGSACTNDLFLLRFVAVKETDSRFCFSVSKKISKSAVIRNKLRRSGYRLLARELHSIKSNTLAIFSFRALPKSEREIQQSLEAILRDSKLIK